MARRPYSTAAPSSPSPAKYARFTAEEDEIIRRSRLEGHKFITIAKALGRSPEATHVRWRRYILPGLPDYPSYLKNARFSPRNFEQVAELVKAGHGPQEIANRLGLSYSTTTRYQAYLRQGRSRQRKPSNRIPWMPEEENQLLQMYEDGMKYAAMAERLQRSIPSIGSRLRNFAHAGRMVFDKAPRWSPEHEDLLRSLVTTQKLSWQEIVGHFPGRTINGVRERWRQMGTRTRTSYGPPMRLFTPEELAQLYKLKEGNLSWKEIADQFPGRTPESLRKKWAKRNDYRRAGRRKRDWSREDVERLEQLVDQLGPDWNAIAKQLDRGRDSTYNMHRLVVSGLANTQIMPATRGS